MTEDPYLNIKIYFFGKINQTNKIRNTIFHLSSTSLTLSLL